MILKACEILELLSKTPGRLDKEEILKENKNNEELKFIFETAFNPYLVYGVKDFEVNKVPHDVPILDNLKRLRQDLIEGKITGNLARDFLSRALSSYDELVNRWLKATFQKNITCGVDIKTINKIWGNLIPIFEVGLCETFEGEELPEGEWCVEPKLDGLRAICMIDEKGNISFKSRNGRELFNLEHIKEELKAQNLRNIILDGEVFAGNWETTASITHSEKNVEGKDKTKVKYYIFDGLTLEEWKKKESPNYLQRKKFLELSIKENKSLVLVKSNLVNNLEKAKSFYNNYLDSGFEGVVLKNITEKYPFKRSKNWLKWKPSITEDLEIVDCEEGFGRNTGRLGKFICMFENRVVGVGGGYSDEQRELFWAQRKEMIGKIIEVKAQEVTPDGSLRFPIFMRFRIDK